MHAHTNHLIHETSPYLLMHAHNPVDWYPWGDEAFAKARRVNKPIFLSVGYATCYWCHVMERESFENEAVAAVLNHGFVSIKVDREERPDVDELYMLAVQLVTGQGGWPMSVFLTPDLKPFYGGTYFPPDDRHGRPGFTSLLNRISGLWQKERPALDGQAEQLAKAIGENSAAQAGGRLGRDMVDRAVQAILRRADPLHGGSAGSPKFPPDMDCAFLLAVHRRTQDPKILAHVTRTLDQMAIGGLWDHLGGGFHRYSTDQSWTVPHFEKMLYNQAGLLRLYADAAVLTGKPFYRRVAATIAAFVQRELTDPELGAFYSALDAETEGEEGKSYVWTREEATAALGDEGELFRRLYGLDGLANFEHGRHVLRLARPLADTAAEMHLTEEQLLATLEPARVKLLAARGRRPQPITDDKVLTSWNGLMIGALAHAGQVLGDPAMVAQARLAAAAVVAHLDKPETGLLRVWRKGVAKQPAFLDDCAALADGLLDLAEATGDVAWRARAEALADAMIQRFAAPDGGFFYTASGDHELFVRSRNPYDNALPSGASSAAEALYRLAAATGRADLRQRAAGTLDSLASFAEQSPSGFTNLLRVAEEHAGAAPAPAATDSAAHVHLSARRTKTGIEVRLRVDAGWHIYAHDIGMLDVIPIEVTVPGGVAEYPAARSTSPLAGGLAVAVYEGDVIIPVRMGKGSGPVSVEVAVQACNDHVCLKPATLRCELR